MMNKKITTLIMGLSIGIIVAGMLLATGGTSAVDEEKAPTAGDTIHAEEVNQTPTPAIEAIPLVYKVESEAQIPIFTPDEAEVEMLAKTIWGEARGVKSTTEKAAVAWCILNRVDSEGYACGGDIEYVLTFPGQFAGYNENNPVTAECKEIAADVLTRWAVEKAGAEDAGRVLPKQYIYFTGDGEHNHFTDEWKGGNTWDWSLPSPYED